MPFVNVKLIEGVFTPAPGAVIQFTHRDSLSTARNGGLGLPPGQSQL
jgi:hypothetical protein